MSLDPFPFATVTDLQARWPDMPAGSEDHAETLLEDASQFIVDVVPSAVDAPVSTRRRVVCAVVRRSMEAATVGQAGLSQFSLSTGPFVFGGSPANAHGDFYLTRNEKRALGFGRPRAFGLQIAGFETRVGHEDWCVSQWGIGACSCGFLEQRF